MIKLKKILLSLSKSERLDILKWLKFEFDHNLDDLSILYLAFCDSLNDPTDKVKTFRRAFPNMKFEDKKWRYLVSSLYSSVYRYLSYKEFKSEPIYEKVLGLRQLHKRGLSKVFDKESKRVSILVEKSKYRNAQYAYYDYLLEEELYEEESGDHRQSSGRIQTQSDKLNTLFILKKLQIYCSAESHASISGMSYEDAFYNQVVNSTDDGEIGRVIQIYQIALLALKGEAGEHGVEKLIKALENIEQLLTKREARDLYLMAINYCIRKYNESHGEYLEKVFDLYKRGLMTSVFIENKVLSRFTYRNICSAAIGLENHEWAEAFLTEYRPYLGSKYRNDHYNYNLAMLYSSQKKYPEAIVLLRDSKIDDPLLLLNARRLLIKIYYQQKEFRALSYLLDSFWSYLYRHKELGYHRENYLKLVKYLRKLLQIPEYDVEQKRNLASKIKEDSSIAEKKWLIDQLE